ncbi:T9SS type A sorting domain-containing protein [Chitinophagales bacterium]|nr:T9SS type A sorting domain-containing protein [Chitinophagales bacterium]
MKRTLHAFLCFSLMFVLGQSSLFAQEILLSEDFAAGLPADWTAYDIDMVAADNTVADWTNGGVDISNWAPGTIGGQTFMLSTSWLVDDSVETNDWLVSPAIQIPADGEFFLNWDAVVFQAEFPDGYQVYVSGGNTVDDFLFGGTLVFETPAENATITSRNVSLLANAGETVYIAWRNNSLFQNAIAITNVEVSDALPAGQCEGFTAGAFVEPAANTVCPDDFATYSLVQDGTQTEADEYGLILDLTASGFGTNIYLPTDPGAYTLGDLATLIESVSAALLPGSYTVLGTYAASGLPADGNPTNAECISEILSGFVFTVLSDLDVACGGAGEIPGCTNPAANNYDELANVDDGSCMFDTVDVSDECGTATALDLPTDVENPLVTGPYDLNAENATVAADDPAYPDCFDTSATDVLSNTQWFTFTGNGETFLFYTSNNCGDFTLGGAPFDSQIAIYTGECGALTEVACNEDWGNTPPTEGFEAGVIFTTEEGVDYSVLVDGWGNDVGSYCMRIEASEPPPPCTTNGDFADGTELVNDFNPLCTQSLEFSLNQETLELGYVWEAIEGAVELWLVSSADPMGGNPVDAGGLFYIGAAADGSLLPLISGTPEGFDPYGEPGPAGNIDHTTLYFTPVLGVPDGEGGISSFSFLGACPFYAGSSIQINYLVEDLEVPCDDILLSNAGTCIAPENTSVAIDGMNDAPTAEGFTTAEGFISAFILTDLDGNILAVEQDGVFSFAGLAEGEYQVYHFTIEGNSIALAVATDPTVNATIASLDADETINGDVSDNSITFTLGGAGCDAEAAVIATVDLTTFCVDDAIDDIVTVTTTGGVGESIAYVVTDTDLTILAISPTPTIDFTGAPAGTCLIWQVNFDGELMGAEVALNAGDLVGCFALSNSIEIVREICEEPCDVEGAVIATVDATTFCVDDAIDDIVNVTTTGGTGEFFTYVVTDTDLTILAVSASPAIDFTGAPAGVCLIWQVNFDGELTGVEPGMNAGDVTGCFALSEPITITREICDDPCAAASGTIGGFDANYCAGADVTVTAEGNNTTADFATAYVMTTADAALTILALSLDGNFAGLVPGDYLPHVLNLAAAEVPADLGALIGLSAVDVLGTLNCFDITTAAATLTVLATAAESGTIGGFDASYCAGSVVTVTAEGNNTTADFATAYVMTTNDAALTILALSLDGNFAGLASGDYLPHVLNLAVTEVPADLGGLIGVSALDVLATLNCFDLTTAAAPTTVLTPVEISIDYQCDPDAGVYTITVAVSGGLPEFDGSNYEMTGSFNDSEFALGADAVIEFSENVAYEFSVVDGLGCAAEASDTPEPCTKVAIELLSFNGRAVAQDNELSWSTASETGNDYFAILRSTDGINFEEIGTVNAAGNSNTVLNYNFTDKNAPQVSTAYYQLIDMNESGFASKSSVITIDRTIEGNAISHVSPVPAFNNVQVGITAVQDVVMGITIYDITGKVLQTIDIEVVEGSSTIDLDISNLATGIYIFTANDGSAMLEGRFIKE